MIVYDMEQRTPEWHAVRAGKITSTGAEEIFTPTGKLTTKDRRSKYLNALCAEWIRGTSDSDGYQSYWMQRGVELEEDARRSYAFIADYEIATPGFIATDGLACGCSPDGLVGDDGMVEIKVVKDSTLVGYYRLMGNAPSSYIIQLQWHLFVTGRKWVDFFAWSAGMKPYLTRIERHSKLQDLFKSDVPNFLDELERIKLELLNMGYGPVTE